MRSDGLFANVLYAVESKVRASVWLADSVLPKVANCLGGFGLHTGERLCLSTVQHSRQIGQIQSTSKKLMCNTTAGTQTYCLTPCCKLPANPPHASEFSTLLACSNEGLCVAVALKLKHISLPY